MENLKFIEVLLSITFIYGVIRLITILKIFNHSLGGFFQSLTGNKNQGKTIFGETLLIFDIWFFYFSLCFQSWYWIFNR